MKKMWNNLDTDVKLGIGCFCLYMMVYAIADICEFIGGMLI